jgi:hypothetical protein
MNPLRRHTMQAFAAALLAACGGGGGGDGGGSTPQPAVDYLPLAVGNRWVFDDGSGSRVTGQRTVDGASWWVSSDTAPGGAADGESLFTSDSQGVRVYQAADPPAPAVVTTLLRLPVTAGDRYPAYRQSYTAFDYDGNGTADTLEARADVEVIGTERVVTPAGTFDGAAHLRVTYLFTIVYRPSGNRDDYASGTADFWYAPGIGPAKLTSSITTRGVPQTANTLLAGYRVGSRTGGTLPGD